jgi:hypothetical protein
MRTQNLKIICVTALLGFLPALAIADPEGAWNGVISNGTTRVPITARFERKSVEIHFGAPVSCNVKGSYVGPDGAVLIYNVDPVSTTGTFCDGLKSSLEIGHTDGSEDMSISVMSSGIAGGNRWKGNLTKQDGP